MMTVAKFLDEVCSSTTLRFAEYVEINHIDRDFSYSTDWRNIAFAAKCIMCDFHVNNQQKIDSISIEHQSPARA